MQFQKMNQEYIKKNYPSNSFFQTYAKKMLGNQILGNIFAFVMMIGGFYLTYFIWKRMQNPELELDQTVGWIMIIFFLIFSLLMFWLWIIMIKRMMRKSLGSMKMCAKESKYTLQDIEQFEEEALNKDSIILNMAGEDVKENRHNAFYDQKDGILTKNYLCLQPGEFIKLMKIKDIDQTYIVNQKIQNTPSSHLMIYIFSKQKTVTQAFCTEECARELESLLKERNKTINSFDKIFDGLEFFKIYDKILSKKEK